MNKLFLLSVILLFGCAANAQYNPEILGYNLYFAEINQNETMPAEDFIVRNDTTIVFVWEHNATVNPPYITLYQTIMSSVQWIPNTPVLWNGTDSTTATEDISFQRGVYEITVTAVDTLQYQSGHSLPIYMKVTAIIATIPFNLRAE